VEALEERTVPAILQVGIPDWLSAGPAPATFGQVSNLPGANPDAVTGAVAEIWAHPTNPDLAFAAGVNGGVWRTTNAQAAEPVWTPLTDSLPSQSIGAMSIDPSNPNRLLAVVGRFSSYAGVGTDLVGAYYTEDALAARPIFRVFGQLNGMNLSGAIARSNYLIVTGDQGTFRSLDNGATWQQLDWQGGLGSDVGFDLQADPVNVKRVYVAGSGGVFRCDDITAASPQWVDITTPNMGITPATDNIKIAIHRSTVNVVYVAVAAGDIVSVNWSTNLGSTWNLMDLPISLTDPGTILDATFATPISINSPWHGLQTGDRVLIEGVAGNLEANGVWTITRTGVDDFTLNGSAGTGVYTGGGTWRKLFYTNPGRQSSIHFALTAHPTDPNLVFISGDRQEFTFINGLVPNFTGATNFTGVILRGDRSQTPWFGAKAPSPQWTPITDNFAAGGGAPHADSRSLAFDALGNLWEGDDGGIYKRTIPTSNNGKWVSANGNISLGQFVSVSWDKLNNVTFGGTQDTGTVQQTDGKSLDGSTTGPGNPVWTTTPRSLGGALMQGDGGYAGVDNFSVPNNTLRYHLGNGFPTLIRNQYNASNTLVASNFVRMASPTDPTPFSGLDASDGVLNVFTSKYVLNVIDPRLMLIGDNKLYEDNDPIGKAGDVIAKVTPAGMTGRVNAMIYGGKQDGFSFKRIAWVGTTSGELYVRGVADGFFSKVPLPGTGGIDDVAVDPDDWQHVYVLRGGDQIYESTDAGKNFTDISENLVGTKFDVNGNLTDGLSTQLTALDVWDPSPGTTVGGHVLIAGGRGGVFRRVPGVADPAVVGGNWLEYGAQVPNTLVSDIKVYDDRIVVGTQGRGTWIVTDASKSILSKAEIIVQGNDLDNILTLTGDPSNPNFIVVSDGLGNTLRIERSAVQGVRMVGLGGSDKAIITATGVAGGDLTFVRFPVDVNLGGQPDDTLFVTNARRTTPVQVTVAANQIGGAVGDNLFASTIGTKVTYSGLGQGGLVLDLGADAADDNHIFVRSSAAGLTRLVGGPKADAFRINSKAGIGDTGDLAGLGGNLLIDGRSGNDELTVSDYGAAAGNTVATITDTAILGFGGPSDTAVISYTNIPSLIVLGSNNSALAEQFRVQGPNALFTLAALDGPDQINVRATAFPVQIEGGLGDDFIRVSTLAGDSDFGDLTGIRGQLGIDAGPGDNHLLVSNFGDAGGSTFRITDTAIIGPTPSPIFYQATGGGRFAHNQAGDGVAVIGSNTGGDTFNVVVTLAGSHTAVDGAGGNDVINLTAFRLAGDVWARGGSGSDTFSVDPGLELGNAANSLRLSGNGGGFDTAVLNGFTVDDTVGVTLTDSTGGRFTGVGKPVDFDTLSVLTFDGRTGRNNMTVTDATNAAYGTTGDPRSGVVYRATGETSGDFVFAGGTVGPQVSFRNVNGSDAAGLVYVGDPTGTGQYEDFLSVLGVSVPGLGTGGPTAEVIAASGIDTVFVSDRTVTLSNLSLGYLRSVAIGRVNDQPTVAALAVLGGNEAGKDGDQFTVVPSDLVNIFVDGGGPTRRPGDKITVQTTEPTQIIRGPDPVTGANQTRITTPSGAGFAFAGFENLGGAANIFAASADVGGGPRVVVYEAKTKNVLFDRFVYDPNFRGGVRVATGDVTGDGVPDLVTGAGVGGGPHVQVFDGATFETIASFFAYEPTFNGGMYVAIGDLDGDGVGEIITGTGRGGGPLVRVFDGTGSLLTGFFAYDPAFRGGVRVGAGDVNGDGNEDILTGAGPGGGPHVRALNAKDLTSIVEFLAFPANYTAGVYVAGGDMTGDGVADIVVGPGGNDRSQVVVRKSGDGSLIPITVVDIGVISNPGSLPAVGNNVLSASVSESKAETGIRVATVDFIGDGQTEQIVTTRGPGYPPRIRFYTVDPPAEAGNFLAFEPTYVGGVFVG
jgi:hypothetical protein